MKYKQIGFSNIRLPDDRNSNIYKYSSNNTFPQEVFLHEFLHTLERNEKENGNDIVALHDYSVFGYEVEPVEGLKDWYVDYMQNTIDGGTAKGLTSFAFASKPIHESNFEYSIELLDLREPQNLIEEIITIIDRIKNLFTSREE